MNVNESAAASTKVVGAAAIISRALYRVLTHRFPFFAKVARISPRYKMQFFGCLQFNLQNSLKLNLQKTSAEMTCGG